MGHEEKKKFNWNILIVILIIFLSLLFVCFVYNLDSETDPIQELKEDIQLCKEYCEELQSDNGNITACRFEYQTEITNIEHEEWELFHCRVYYIDGRIYGKFVGDFE